MNEQNVFVGVEVEARVEVEVSVEAEARAEVEVSVEAEAGVAVQEPCLALHISVCQRYDNDHDTDSSILELPAQGLYGPE